MREDFALLQNEVYSVRTEGGAFRVTKFTKELNPVSFYQVKEHPDGSFSCNCPQSNRGACRHMDIMDAFGLYPERVDKGWFYCYENGDWFPPIDGQTPLPAPPSGEGEAKDPSPASPATPEVEAMPPKPPSGVGFSRRGL